MAEKKTVLTAKDKSEKALEPVRLTPRVTEKAVAEEGKNTYCFFIDLGLSKQEIKSRVEKDYTVTVESVRTLVRNGKKCRFSRGKHVYPGTSFRRDRKLAYVTLKAGDKIQLFAEEKEKN